MCQSVDCSMEWLQWGWWSQHIGVTTLLQLTMMALWVVSLLHGQMNIGLRSQRSMTGGKFQLIPIAMILSSHLTDPMTHYQTFCQLILVQWKLLSVEIISDKLLPCLRSGHEWALRWKIFTGCRVGGGLAPAWLTNIASVLLAGWLRLRSLLLRSSSVYLLVVIWS